MKHLLLVAVDPTMVPLVRTIFDKVQFERVASGQEALEVLPQQEWDGIVIGSELPDMDPTELERRCRQAIDGLDLPVQVLPDRLWASLRDGVDALARGGTRPAESDARQNRMADLRDQFLALAQQRLAEVRRAEAALSAGSLSEEVRRAATTAAHNLAGTAATFGYTAATDLARQIEQALGNPAVTVAELCSLTRQTAAALTLPLPAPGSATEPEKRNLGLLVVDDDPVVLGSYQMAGEALGFEVRTARSATSGRVLFDQVLPDLVIVDISFPNDPSGGFGITKVIRQANRTVPVIILSANGSLPHRLTAARLGADRYFEKPEEPEVVLKEGLRLLSKMDSQRTAILLVSDEGALNARVAAALGGEASLTPCSDPATFWRTLAETQPDLILLDWAVGGVPGSDLCRVVRADLRYGSLPVMMLCDAGSAEQVAVALAAGADDLVDTEREMSTLARRIRFFTARSQHGLDRLDPKNQMQATRQSIRANLRRMLQEAQQAGKQFSVAMIDMDRLQDLNQRHGHQAADAIVQEAMRLVHQSLLERDLVGRWESDMFAIVMADCTKAEAHMRLNKALDRLRMEPSFQSIRLTFSGGVAEYGADGTDEESLVRAAIGALKRAKEAGRAQVMAAGYQAPPVDLDVLLVEDDPLVGALVAEAIEAFGLKWAWFQSGVSARDALIGASACARPRLILLDLTLPDLDGVDLLRQLAEQGQLKRTRVMILTGRTSQETVVQCLRLGATDYVVKPFQAAALVQRVRQALAQ